MNYIQYNQYNQNYPYPFQPPQNPYHSVRQIERRKLRKLSSGLGFFALTYLICFTLIQIFLSIIDFRSHYGFFSGSTITYVVEILISIAAGFIPGLFYFIISRRKISESIRVKRVEAKLLIPIVFVGLGGAMIANVATDIFLNNIGIFGLENTVNFTEDAYTLPDIILSIIATAVVPALIEEFTFRGIIMGGLRKFGDAFAILVSSIVFGAFHGNMTQAVFAFFFFFLFAFFDCKTNSIIPSIIIHFSNNLYAVLMDLMQNTDAISDEGFYILYYGLTAVVTVIAILSFVYLIRRDNDFFGISDLDKTEEVNANVLSFKEKVYNFFFTPGMIILSVCMISEIITSIGLKQ